MDSKSEIILYQPDNEVRLEVRLEDETVWLTQAQMAELFQTTSQNITIHLRSIYSENELGSEATCKDSLQVRREGNRVVRRKQKMYNLIQHTKMPTESRKNLVKELNSYDEGRY